MAHEIETMAYANAVPWHGLGAQVSDSVSIDEMLKAAGLDWRVELKPLRAQIDENTTVEVPGRFALVRDRDNKIMTITGAWWNPLQNAESIGFMRDYVEAGGAKLETAGSLRGGKIIWGLAKLNHSFSVGKGDKVEGYMLITSPHEVGRAITIRTTTVRVVCANTLALANNHSEIHYRQSHHDVFDFSAAKKAVAIAHDQLAQAERRAKTIKALKISIEDAVNNVLVPVFTPKLADSGLSAQELIVGDKANNKIAQLVYAMQNSPGADVGTGWGVLNGVTYWADHMAGRTGEGRLFRSWMGDTGRHKLEVEEKLLQLAA